jgi:opacity protein-like surface antigen
MRKEIDAIAFSWSSLFFTAFAVTGPAQGQLYYRVDTGLSKSTGADIKNKDSKSLICGNAGCNTPGALDKDVGSSIILSGGVGRRFTPNMRADVTLGYRGGYKIDDSDKDVPARHFKADVKSLALMANVYRDFPLAALTPYVGASLGFAQNKIGTISFEQAGARGTAPGGTKTGLAIAFMAGAGYPLPGSLTLDVGYRFIDLGKIESGTGDVIVNGVVSGPYAGATGKLKAHELTVGLRF